MRVGTGTEFCRRQRDRRLRPTLLWRWGKVSTSRESTPCTRRVRNEPSRVRVVTVSLFDLLSLFVLLLTIHPRTLFNFYPLVPCDTRRWGPRTSGGSHFLLVVPLLYVVSGVAVGFVLVSSLSQTTKGCSPTSSFVQRLQNFLAPSVKEPSRFGACLGISLTRRPG